MSYVKKERVYSVNGTPTNAYVTKSSKKRARKGVSMVAPAAAIRSEVQRAEMREAYKRAGYVDIAAGTLANPIKFHVAPSNSLYLTPVPCNAGIQGRIGGNIKLKSLQIKGLLIPVAGATVVGDWCQMLIVYDRCPPKGSNTIPAITDVLVAGSGPQNLLNNDNRERFLIVRKMDYNLRGNTTDVAYSQFVVDEYIKLKGLKTIFVGASTGTGELSECKEGALYVYFIGTKAADATTTGNFFGNIRLRFADVKG